MANTGLIDNGCQGLSGLLSNRVKFFQDETHFGNFFDEFPRTFRLGPMQYTNIFSILDAKFGKFYSSTKEEGMAPFTRSFAITPISTCDMQ